MKNVLISWLLVVFICLCLGCTTTGISEAEVKSAYKTSPGPLPITIAYRTELDFPELEKNLRMRIVFPEQAGSYPLIIFSHGNGCLQDLYAGFADHWASWGYVVIQPVHLDSAELGFTMKSATLEIMNKVIDSRPRDVQLILDSLDQLENQVAGLRGKIDAERLVMAGHSMGAGTAMMLNGVIVVDPRDGSELASDEDRFDAMILISEPSNNRIMPHEPWRMAKVPTYIATGSEDFSSTGSRDGKKSRNAYQLPTDAVLPDQPHYYLFMEGSDHYLGGLICRGDVPGPHDAEALQIINGSSMAFLDAFIGNDAAAQAFLDSAEISALTDNRASLKLR